MAIANRNFGVEIEAFGISRQRAAQAITQAGYDALVEGYNHNVRPHWKVTTDASISNGFEVVSPVLQGEQGVKAVRDVCKALVRAGAKVDRRCGLHVHVSVDGLGIVDLRNLMARYIRHEETIDKIMPRSRRGNSNEYCRSNAQALGGLDQFRNNNFRSIDEFTEIFRSCVRRNVFVSDARHVKLNILSVIRQGTVEFRQHSGTVNATKATNWVRFCVNFVEQSKVVRQRSNNRSARQTTSRRRRNSLNDKYLAVLGAAQVEGDLSVRKISQLTGWHRNSVPMYISKMRDLGVRIKKIRGTSLYAFNRHTAHAVYRRLNQHREQNVDWDGQLRQAARNVQNSSNEQLHESPFYGLSREVRAYFEERMMELEA